MKKMKNENYQFILLYYYIIIILLNMSVIKPLIFKSMQKKYAKDFALKYKYDHNRIKNKYKILNNYYNNTDNIRQFGYHKNKKT